MQGPQQLRIRVSGPDFLSSVIDYLGFLDDAKTDCNLFCNKQDDYAEACQQANLADF